MLESMYYSFPAWLTLKKCYKHLLLLGKVGILSPAKLTGETVSFFVYFLE